MSSCLLATILRLGFFFFGNDALIRESEFEGCLCFEERIFFHGIVK